MMRSCADGLLRTTLLHETGNVGGNLRIVTHVDRERGPRAHCGGIELVRPLESPETTSLVASVLSRTVRGDGCQGVSLRGRNVIAESSSCAAPARSRYISLPTNDPGFARHTLNAVSFSLLGRASCWTSSATAGHGISKRKPLTNVRVKRVFHAFRRSRTLSTPPLRRTAANPSASSSRKATKSSAWSIASVSVATPNARRATSSFR